MRIKRIRIVGYGPIDKLVLTPGDFEIIFGLNEAGKTALVEVLAYVLFRKTAINLRYGKAEDVLVEVEDNGHTASLPGKRTDLDLPAGDVANLLYVQSSESNLFGTRGEAGFWDGVKSMLSKVGSGVPFTKLDTQIFEAVGLQPKKEEWKKDKQLEIESKTKRKNDLGGYIERIGEIGKKEVALGNLLKRNEDIKNKLDLIGQHKGFHDYQELRRLHNLYQETQTGLQEYERYKYEYLTAWQKLKVERETRADEGVQVEEVEKEKIALEKEISELEQIGQRINTEDLLSAVGDAEERARMPSLVFPLLAISIAVLATVLSFFTRLPMLPSLIFLAGALLTLLIFMRRRGLVRKSLAAKNDWLARSKKIFPDIESLADLRTRIAKTQEEKLKKQTAVQEKTRMIERLMSARSLETVDREITDLRSKTGLAVISDLEKNLSEKRRLETELEKLGASLNQRLHEADPRKWERMIKDRQVKHPDSDVDLETERDLLREQSEAKGMIDTLTREVRLFRDVEQARVGIKDDREAFQKYEELEEELSEYELMRKAALAARKILGEMSRELDEFIGGILQGDQGLSEYFKTVTGRYQEVVVEKKNFVVVDEKGRKFRLEHLSSGTQDQLLLCFRMAALKNIYPKGAFMILDDAFIFADWQRRQKLALLLQKFVEQGNQVIYLTSDDHTRELFSKHGANVISLP